MKYIIQLCFKELYYSCSTACYKCIIWKPFIHSSLSWVAKKHHYTINTTKKKPLVSVWMWNSHRSWWCKCFRCSSTLTKQSTDNLSLNTRPKSSSLCIFHPWLTRTVSLTSLSCDLMVYWCWTVTCDSFSWKTCSPLTCLSQSFICRFFYTQVGFMYSFIMDVLTFGCLNDQVPVPFTRHIFLWIYSFVHWGETQ